MAVLNIQQLEVPENQGGVVRRPVVLIALGGMAMLTGALYIASFFFYVEFFIQRQALPTTVPSQVWKGSYYNCAGYQCVLARGHILRSPRVLFEKNMGLSVIPASWSSLDASIRRELPWDAIDLFAVFDAGWFAFPLWIPLLTILSLGLICLLRDIRFWATARYPQRILMRCMRVICISAVIVNLGLITIWGVLNGPYVLKMWS